jgi:NAD(P)-dependent dehydrogenase (short-subunit alcohol dehydrogenase family)
MAENTHNRIALVTGASSGFGLLFTVALARDGWQVVAAMRSLERQTLLTTAAAQAGVSERVDCHLLDVTDPAQIDETAACVKDRYGRLDLLVNNAGFAMAGFLEDVKLSELRRQFDTNFFGHVAVTKAFLPMMRAQHSGTIVMISSISGRTPFPGVGSYAASKFALEGWSECLRLELKALGIHVVLLEPGAFETDIWTRNVTIGEQAASQSSPNKERSERFVTNVREQTKKADPKPVVDVLLSVARSKNPRARYLIGTDAKMAVALRRLLPASTFEKMLIKMSRIDA